MLLCFGPRYRTRLLGFLVFIILFCIIRKSRLVHVYKSTYRLSSLTSKHSSSRKNTFITTVTSTNHQVNHHLKQESSKEESSPTDNNRKYTNSSTTFKMAFDIEMVISSLRDCHENQMNIASYTKGYSELYNFFNVLGTVFGFIASDVKEKINILDDLEKNTEDPTHSSYETVEKMMLHEIEVNKQTEATLLGSRTLLRLHRALLFTKLFLERLGTMSNNERVGTMATNVYGKSLANHHPWLIRQAANLAMYSLPSRSDMVKKIAPDGIDEQVLKDKIAECVEAMNIVYDQTEALYTKYDLHGLP